MAGIFDIRVSILSRLCESTWQSARRGNKYYAMGYDHRANMRIVLVEIVLEFEGVQIYPCQRSLPLMECNSYSAKPHR